jgi:hypothetical protein
MIDGVKEPGAWAHNFDYMVQLLYDRGPGKPRENFDDRADASRGRAHDNDISCDLLLVD